MDRGVEARRREGTRQFHDDRQPGPASSADTARSVHPIGVHLRPCGVATTGSPSGRQADCLIVCERNGDIAIEHADPHIVIADSFLNQIDNGNTGSYLGLRPPRESAPATGNIPPHAESDQAHNHNGAAVKVSSR